MQPSQRKLENHQRGIIQPVCVVNGKEKVGLARAATKKLSQRNSNVALLQRLFARIFEQECHTQRTPLGLRKSADLIPQACQQIT
jgi:hypothetical protein